MISCDLEQYEFLIKQGQDEFRRIVIIDADTNLPIDINGYSFKSEIRVNYSDATALEEFTCVITEALNGAFVMSLTNIQTSAMIPGDYLFDVKMTDDTGIVTRIIEGKVKVSPEVTR